MTISKDIIQLIRQKKLESRIAELLEQGQELADEMLRLSGLLERGLHPYDLKWTPLQMKEWLERSQGDETQMRGSDLAEHRRAQRPRSV
ncbi:MAG: hypothetical protein QM527_11405 [Alphaproteobacteria bacterium]|nr:hypothetical protein [Alphaproteobacteria bacterium]